MSGSASSAPGRPAPGRVFAPAWLDLMVEDRFGQAVQSRAWFLAPLAAIDAAVARVRDGSIVGCEYDPGTASLRVG